jgi:peptidoglycan/LPS O-acetylase OafA/YrhL
MPELGTTEFTLVDFWERRLRRIFPALAVVVAAVLAVGYVLLLPTDLESLGKSAVAQTLLVANVYFWGDGGYFAGPAELKPLLHTWSLAVEEQFYLAFPILLTIIRGSRKRRLAVLISLAVLSFVISVHGSNAHPSATFYLLSTRAWEPLLGAILAVLPMVALPRGTLRALWP